MSMQIHSSTNQPGYMNGKREGQKERRKEGKKERKKNKQQDKLLNKCLHKTRVSVDTFSTRLTRGIDEAFARELRGRQLLFDLADVLRMEIVEQTLACELQL